MRNSFFSIIKESAHQSALAVGVSIFAHTSEKAIHMAKGKVHQLIRSGAGSPTPEIENLAVEATKVISKSSK